MFVSELGEFGVIAHIAEIIKNTNEPWGQTRDNIVIGIGDDTAVLRNTGTWQLATTDCLVQNIHFSLETTTWEELGWKALAVNLSDIAAMGGIPQYALISLTLPETTRVEDITALYNGMIELANKFNVAIIGGNITSALSLTIHVTLLGNVVGSKVLRRAGAKIKDFIACTGYPGLSAAGLAMLNNRLSFESSIYQTLRQAHLKPMPRVEEGQLLAEVGVEAAIDISDGLIADLTHICIASKASALIRESALPIHPTLKNKFKTNYYDLVLGGGEDYELLFTASKETMDHALTKLLCPVKIIGEITSPKTELIMIVDQHGNSRKPVQAGWDHLRSK